MIILYRFSPSLLSPRKLTYLLEILAPYSEVHLCTCMMKENECEPVFKWKPAKIGSIRVLVLTKLLSVFWLFTKYLRQFRTDSASDVHRFLSLCPQNYHPHFYYFQRVGFVCSASCISRATRIRKSPWLFGSRAKRINSVI